VIATTPKPEVAFAGAVQVVQGGSIAVAAEELEVEVEVDDALGVRLDPVPVCPTPTVEPEEFLPAPIKAADKVL
jgi:hypothetical protein